LCKMISYPNLKVSLASILKYNRRLKLKRMSVTKMLVSMITANLLTRTKSQRALMLKSLFLRSSIKKPVNPSLVRWSLLKVDLRLKFNRQGGNLSTHQSSN
jgi:hypothetical protein